LQTTALEEGTPAAATETPAAAAETSTATVAPALEAPAPRSSGYRAFKLFPFVATHFLAVGAAIYVGVTPRLLLLCAATYFLRMFFITAGFHRYFAHRAYKTSRWFQFVLAFMGETASQKGVLWWAGHHRDHHRYSDQPNDIHSPIQSGFWWAHVGWILSTKHDDTKFEKIRDFASYPELRWLNKYWIAPPLIGSVVVYLVGGLPWLVWGGLVSTVLLWHGTFTINSFSHLIGTRRYETTDTSKNNFVLALITLGEGWHNNHHYYQSSANQGFFFYELDVSYTVLRILSIFRIVWDLRTPPKAVLEGSRVAA
jgi:stearoyl-CoA desaturase (delta-9 desaturase)